MVRKRLKRYPGMHIYHYAAYEKSTLLRLAGRYGVGENEVDELLRDGVLVDLYPLVRKSIRVGTENYSIKSLEPLYMGNELRSGEVTTATDSITAVRPLLRAAGRGARRRSRDRAQGDRGLQPLRLPVDSSAARLAGRPRHRIRGAAARARRVTATARRVAVVDASSASCSSSRATASKRAPPSRPPSRWSLPPRGYHQREDKPFWWAHFDRLNNPVDEWADSTDVFIADAPRSSPTGTHRRRRASPSATCD